MKSLKQDLVGFHWSAFFEPRLPFTRVPVKLPLPHLPAFSLSFSILPLSVWLCPPSPSSHLSAHLPTLQCTYCQLAMVTPTPSFLTCSLSCDLWAPSPDFLYSVIFVPMQVGCRATLSRLSLSPTHTCILTHLPKTFITKSIPLSICKTLRGPFFSSLFPYFLRGVGDNKMEGFLHSAPFLVLLSL